MPGETSKIDAKCFYQLKTHARRDDRIAICVTRCFHYKLHRQRTAQARAAKTGMVQKSCVWDESRSGVDRPELNAFAGPVYSAVG
jgi:hypothetical protein